MSLFSKSTPTIAFAPADRFFFRIIPIAEGTPAAQQAELALEGLAPFPPAQLFWGCCLAPDRSHALVYAAHRRRFSAEEIAAWERAESVVPDVLCLLGAGGGASGAVKVLAKGNQLAGAAWTAGSDWPVAVQGRALAGDVDDSSVDKFGAELAARAGIAADRVTRLGGSPRSRRVKDQLFLELVDATGNVIASTPVARGDEDALDVRDRAFLEKQRGERRRANLVWRVMLGGIAAAIVALLLDASALGLRLLANSRASQNQGRVPLVQKLESLHSLTSRVDDLTKRRLRFFEMLSAVNGVRPPSIQFTRSGTNGRNGLEIEGRTSSASDVAVYESALRRHAALDKVDMTVQGREGVTTFRLSVTFKPEASLTTAPKENAS